MKKNIKKIIFNTMLVFAIQNKAIAKDLISITAVGDIMMGTTYPYNALPENNGAGLFLPAKQWIEASDIRFGNFEGTFYDGNVQPDGKSPGPNRWIFKTPTSYGATLAESGFNVVSLANNHVKDFGQAGIESTKTTLKKNGIQYSSKAGEVAEFKVDQTDLVLLATDFYSGNRSIVQPASTYLEISQLKKSNRLVIVSAHAGGEGAGADKVTFGSELFLGENRGDSVSFARNAIDYGADVVIMHGPHVPRAIEIYNKRIIIYSLGNFMTGQGISLNGYSNLAPLVRLQIQKNGEFKTGQLVSFIQKRSPQRIELDLQHTAMRLIKQNTIQQFPKSAPQFFDNGLFE